MHRVWGRGNDLAIPKDGKSTSINGKSLEMSFPCCSRRASLNEAWTWVLVSQSVLLLCIWFTYNCIFLSAACPSWSPPHIWRKTKLRLAYYAEHCEFDCRQVSPDSFKVIRTNTPWYWGRRYCQFKVSLTSSRSSHTRSPTCVQKRIALIEIGATRKREWFYVIRAMIGPQDKVSRHVSQLLSFMSPSTIEKCYSL